jgi:sulfur carrier protein ThiS adenylyltransferase
MPRITVNERPTDVPGGETLFRLRDKVKPGADVLVLNGYPSETDEALADGDVVVLIRRGERPSMEDVEYMMAARHTPGVHSVLKKAVVGIAGLGGLGSAVAVALARSGVGGLVLADLDVVEPSNLNRQQYYIDQVGIPKTEALKYNLGRINPFVNVETHTVILDEENLPEVFGKVDALVEAFDAPRAKAMLLNTMLFSRPSLPIVAASGVAGFGPSNDITTRPFGGNCFIVGDLVSEAAAGTGLMAPRVGVAAHHQANCVLRILLGESGD